VGPSPFLLDSSAILTLLEDEAGADRVEEVIHDEETGSQDI
jgi:PIN domain nuclease of toxin-antitoxin system